MLIPKPYKVAIIDDSATVRGSLKAICDMHPSFEAHAFDNPGDGLRFIEAEKVRLVLTDINMPGMYGDDVLRHCMALKLGIQVYMVTGADSLTVSDRCMNIGSRGIIPKSMLQEGCRQALRDTERFLENWNASMIYFIGQKKAG